MREQAPTGIALYCEKDGTINQWLLDDSGMRGKAGTARGLIGLIHESSHTKALELLSQLRQTEAVVEWELCLLVAGQPEIARVAGARFRDGVVVIAAHSDEAMEEICHELVTRAPDMRSTCDALLGQLRKAKADQPRLNVYDELMRLYNDLSRLQRDYANQNAKLERMNEERHRIMCMAVHDLRNPLTIMVMLANSLSQTVADRLTSKELFMLENISKTGRNMSSALTEALEMMRRNPGSPQLRLASCLLGDLVAECVDNLQHLADNKNITVTLFRDDNLSPLPCDAGQLRHVFENLIGNAIKFSPPGSEIDVRLTSINGLQRLVVSDQGPGIPASDLSRIFEAFEKGTATPTAGEESSGLGLSICRKIVEVHGGNIWAENAPAGGAMFLVDLPAVDSSTDSGNKPSIRSTATDRV